MCFEWRQTEEVIHAASCFHFPPLLRNYADYLWQCSLKGHQMCEIHFNINGCNGPVLSVYMQHYIQWEQSLSGMKDPLDPPLALDENQTALDNCRSAHAFAFSLHLPQGVFAVASFDQFGSLATKQKIKRGSGYINYGHVLCLCVFSCSKPLHHSSFLFTGEYLWLPSHPDLRLSVHSFALPPPPRRPNTVSDCSRFGCWPSYFKYHKRMKMMMDKSMQPDFRYDVMGQRLVP